jgi:hypothetical protein
MFNSEPTTRAELEAWARHPETVARMAEVEAWLAEQRQRKWEEAELAAKRLTLEKEAAERRQREEREARERRQREERDLARAHERAMREREARSRLHGLLIRPARYEKKGDHEFWSTGFRTRRMVHGICSTPTITSNNHSRSSAGCKIDFPIPLLVSHENFGSVGEVVMLRRSPREI